MLGKCSLLFYTFLKGMIYMAILINSEYGEVTVDNNVIASIAGSVASKCYGVVGMASRGTKDGLVSLLKSDNMTKGIKVSVEDSGIVVGMHIRCVLNYVIIVSKVAGLGWYNGFDDTPKYSQTRTVKLFVVCLYCHNLKTF